MLREYLPATDNRVIRATNDDINRRIREETDHRVARLAQAGTDAVHRRLAELDREWDIERTLEANASTLALTGVVLGFTVHRRFFYLSGAVATFLLQHALQGWCPPIPIFRRMGVRTTKEINEERYALKALLGHFDQTAPNQESPAEKAKQALGAVRR